MANQKQTIVVFGATGNQGRAVALSLHQNPRFRVVGITRNPDSERAKSLKAAGIDVVKADGLKKEEMLAALKGAWGLFVNTNTSDPELDFGRREVELGKLIFDAAKEAGVEVVVYSALPDAKGLSNGENPVLSFDSKHEIQGYVSGLGFTSASFVHPGWYMENFLMSGELANAAAAEGQKAEEMVFGGFPTIADQDGVLSLRMPDLGKYEGLPLISIEDDFGDIVHGLFLNPTESNGRTVQGVSETVKLDELVEQFTEATTRPARYIKNDINAIPAPDAYMEDMLQTWRFGMKMEGRMFGTPANPEPAKALKKAVAETVKKDAKQAELRVWRDWVKTHYN